MGMKYSTWTTALVVVVTTNAVADQQATTLRIRERVALQEGSQGGLFSVAFSPDGKKLAAGGWLPGAEPSGLREKVEAALMQRHLTGGVRVWDLHAAKLDFEVLGLLAQVKQVAFSPDGKTLAAACGSYKKAGEVRLLDVPTGQLRATLRAHGGWVCALALAPDGRMLVTCGAKSPESEVVGGEIKLWDLAKNQQRSLWEDNGISFGSVAFSPDGTLFATGGGRSIYGQPYRDMGLVKVWEAGTGKARFTLKGHNWPIESVVFSPDGKVLVSGGGKFTLGLASKHELRFWNMNDGKLIDVVNVNQWWPESRLVRFGDMAYSPDGRLLAVPMGSWNRGGRWGELWFYNIGKKSAETVVLFPDHPDPITAAAFSPDGSLLAACGADGTLKVWEVTPTGAKGK